MKPPNILLINPWIYDFAAYDFWIKPLGLLSIGSVLKKFGYRTTLIDCLDRFHPDQHNELGHYRSKKKHYGTGKFRREPVLKPDILKHVPRTYCRYGISLATFNAALSKAPHPDVIMITSMMTYWYPGPFKVIEIVKKKYPKVPVVLGGIYATLFHDHALKHSGADYILRGPGEKQALQLADKLTGNRSDWSLFPQNWIDFPEPDFDHYQNLLSVPIQTSRGCPFQCSFCASQLLSGKFKQKYPQKIVSSIEHYHLRRGVKHFAFIDDALLVNPDTHIKKILNSVIDKKLDVTFHTPNGMHASEIDMELAELMYRSNFKTLRLSYESSNKDRQAEMFDKVTDESLVTALNFFERAGYDRRKIDVYVIMGLPGQTLEEIVESMAFVMSLGAKVRLTSFTPIPGTTDWKRAVENYGFDPDIDPLLTNNTLYPLQRQEITSDHFQKLRIICREINYDLDQGGFTRNQIEMIRLAWNKLNVINP